MMKAAVERRKGAGSASRNHKLSGLEGTLKWDLKVWVLFSASSLTVAQEPCDLGQVICLLWALVNKSSAILLAMQSEVVHWVCDCLPEPNPALDKGLCCWRKSFQGVW